MLKNTLLVVAFALCSATLFAPRGGHHSPKKGSSPTAPASPSKSDLELEIHGLKTALESRSLTPDQVRTTTHALTILRNKKKTLFGR